MQLTVSLLYCWGDKIKMQRAGCLYVSPGAPLQGRMVTVSPSSTAFSFFSNSVPLFYGARSFQQTRELHRWADILSSC